MWVLVSQVEPLHPSGPLQVMTFSVPWSQTFSSVALLQVLLEPVQVPEPLPEQPVATRPSIRMAIARMRGGSIGLPGMKRRAFLSLLICTAAWAADWEEVGEADGVKVYRRSLPDRAINSVKGTGIVDAPVHKVALVLLDDAHAPDWVDSLAAARVVRVVHPTEYIEYNHVSMPLVVSDREFVTRVTMQVDAAKKTVTMKSVPADDPLVKKNDAHVRGQLSALYVLESIENGTKTRLSVEVDADPKGSLPAWVVNFFQKDWSRDTIRGIRSQAKKKLDVPKEFTEFLGSVTF